MGTYLWEKYIVIVHIIRIQISIFKKEKISTQITKLHNWTNTNPSIDIKKTIHCFCLFVTTSRILFSHLSLFILFDHLIIGEHVYTVFYVVHCQWYGLTSFDFKMALVMWQRLSLFLIMFPWCFYHLSRTRSGYCLHRITSVSLHFKCSPVPASKRFL